MPEKHSSLNPSEDGGRRIREKREEEEEWVAHSWGVWLNAKSSKKEPGQKRKKKKKRNSGEMVIEKLR